MIATFKETWLSLQDLHYGNQIIKKSLGETLWYWTKYLILSVAVVVGFAVAALTYYTPQLPGILEQNLPDLEISIQDGRFTTNVPQPFIQGSEEFVVIINEFGDIDDLDEFQSGILLIEDKVVAKSDNDIRVVDLDELNGLELNKQIAIDWVANNQLQIILLGIVLGLFIGLVVGMVYWAGRIISFFLWAILVWIAGIALKKRVSFLNSVKITTYASVLPFLLSILIILAPNQVISLLTIVVFLFYAVVWVYNLDTKSK